MRWKHLAEGFRESGARRTCPSGRISCVRTATTTVVVEKLCKQSAGGVFGLIGCDIQMCFRLGGKAVVVRDVGSKAKEGYCCRETFRCILGWEEKRPSYEMSTPKPRRLLLSEEIQMCFRLGGEAVVVQDVNSEAKKATVVVRGRRSRTARRRSV